MAENDAQYRSTTCDVNNDSDERRYLTTFVYCRQQIVRVVPAIFLILIVSMATYRFRRSYSQVHVTSEPRDKPPESNLSASKASQDTRPLCSLRLLQESRDVVGYVPSNGTWIRDDRRELIRFEPNLCRFNHGDLWKEDSRKVLRTCLAVEGVKNVILLGDSNGMRYGFALIRFLNEHHFRCGPILADKSSANNVDVRYYETRTVNVTDIRAGRRDCSGCRNYDFVCSSASTRIRSRRNQVHTVRVKFLVMEFILDAEVTSSRSGKRCDVGGKGDEGEGGNDSDRKGNEGHSSKANDWLSAMIDFIGGDRESNKTGLVDNDADVDNDKQSYGKDGDKYSSSIDGRFRGDYDPVEGGNTSTDVASNIWGEDKLNAHHHATICVNSLTSQEFIFREYLATNVVANQTDLVLLFSNTHDKSRGTLKDFRRSLRYVLDIVEDYLPLAARVIWLSKPAESVLHKPRKWRNIYYERGQYSANEWVNVSNRILYEEIRRRFDANSRPFVFFDLFTISHTVLKQLGADGAHFKLTWYRFIVSYIFQSLCGSFL